MAAGTLARLCISICYYGAIAINYCGYGYGYYCPCCANYCDYCYCYCYCMARTYMSIF